MPKFTDADNKNDTLPQERDIAWSKELYCKVKDSVGKGVILEYFCCIFIPFMFT